jgi:importin-7
MWEAFVLVHQTFKAGAELYLEGSVKCITFINAAADCCQDMLPALENFVTYGTEMLQQNRSYLEAIVDMVRTIFKDEKVGGVDRICGCKLAEIVLLTLRGYADDFVPEFINLAMTVLTNDESKVKSYRVHLMEMVINCIYYNPIIAMQVLESNGWTNKFFSLWFSNMDGFTRVHDKKLSIAAISSLLTLRGEQVPVSVQQGWPRLLQGIVRLFQTLPAALKSELSSPSAAGFKLTLG